MNKKKLNIASLLIIPIFFTLFLVGPLLAFYQTYKIYNLKNLPTINEDDISKGMKGDIITGLLILENKKGDEIDRKLASQYVYPYIRNYRKFNLIEPAVINLFENRTQLIIERFPERYEYGPDSRFFNILIDESELESTMTNFKGYDHVGKITEYTKTDTGNIESSYLIIYDSISDNKTIVLDTFSITHQPTKEEGYTVYTFDTTNFTNSKSEFSKRLYEMGLAIGDTIVGEFKIENEGSNVISPHRIYCYGNPNVIWQQFISNNKFYMTIWFLIMLIPILIIVNLIRRKLNRK